MVLLFISLHVHTQLPRPPCLCNTPHPPPPPLPTSLPTYMYVYVISDSGPESISRIYLYTRIEYIMINRVDWENNNNNNNVYNIHNYTCVQHMNSKDIPGHTETYRIILVA